jgi:hypothetical protein
MDIEYAIDRLYEVGWLPTIGAELETLPDGRKYPAMAAVQREFALAGLELWIKHNMMFNCWRATWAPRGQSPNPSHPADFEHGTVVGATEREAAVYALAQLREARKEAQLTMA